MNEFSVTITNEVCRRMAETLKAQALAAGDVSPRLVEASLRAMLMIEGTRQGTVDPMDATVTFATALREAREECAEALDKDVHRRLMKGGNRSGRFEDALMSGVVAALSGPDMPEADYEEIARVIMSFLSPHLGNEDSDAGACAICGRQHHATEGSTAKDGQD